MFFILTALALSISTVVSQESPFSTLALEELMDFSKKYFGDNWSDDLSERALQWMTKNTSKTARMSYKGRRCYAKPRGDMPDEFIKVAPKFAIPFENQKKKVTTSLGTSANYGCNGIFDKKNPEKDCIIVGCLFSSTN
ncbi:hypothetical protein V3C99_016078 [Haemonchus contortus]